MNILFWNTNRNQNINSYLATLAHEYNADIVAVAEYTADETDLLRQFRAYNLDLTSVCTIGCPRIRMWANYKQIAIANQNEYYTIQVISEDIILCAVHLPSDLHGNHSRERYEIMRDIKYDVEAVAIRINSNKIIIFGDFNENPYNEGCLSANGFHGLPTLKADERPYRIVNSKEYKKYYNPMWGLLGDITYPPGTYYFTKSELYEPRWHMLDQFIISQGLLKNYLEQREIKIITSCKYSKLYTKNKYPNTKISDHFPVFLHLSEGDSL